MPHPRRVYSRGPVCARQSSISTMNFCRRLARDTSAPFGATAMPSVARGLVRAEQVVDTPLGQRFTLVLPDGSATVDTPLLGRYNISNLLAVAAVLHDAGVGVGRSSPPPGGPDAAGRAHGAAGRQWRAAGGGRLCPYARCPRECTGRAAPGVAVARGGRLGVIFGCGGDRDKGKRPQMGAVAARLADYVVLTSDNPRSEEPETIIAEIRAGIPVGSAQANPSLPARSRSRRAIADAAAGDVVVLAGKGHESYQETAGRRIDRFRCRAGANGTRSASSRLAGGCMMNWLLSEIAQAAGGRLTADRTRMFPGCRPILGRSVRGSCSLPCAANASMPMTSSTQAVTAGAVALLVADEASCRRGFRAGRR
jgi:hypothetical protein